MGKNKSSPEEKTVTRDETEIKEPSLYKVLLHNDDYTTMDFVIMVLQTVFKKDTSEATRIMLNVHHQGAGVAGIYTKEIGETKITVVHDLARQHQFPLKCSLERIDS